MTIQRHSLENGNPLPIEWVGILLGEVAQVATGSTPKRTESKYWNDAYMPWLTSSVTGSLYCSEAAQFVSKTALVECRLKVFRKGTLLLAMYGEGKTRGQVTELLFDATCNQACAAITNNRTVLLNTYLKYHLIKNYEATRMSAVGGNQPNLNLSKVREISLPLPPLAEQKVIADKLDTLLAQVETTKTRLDRIPQILKTFRQSVLAAAVSGKLTEEWRENHGFGRGQEIVDNDAINKSLLLTVVVKSFWPRVYSISNTDIPIHSGSTHRYMNAA